MKKQLMSIAVAFALPLTATQAATTVDAQQAVNTLNSSIASAEEAIREAQAQEAVNLLSASIADAELNIAIASANEAIRQVRGQEAINRLVAGVANAELTLALADAQMTVAAVSDEAMLGELNGTLDTVDIDEANDLIMAVVAERPMLAAAVQDIALTAGYSEAMVATAVVSGLGAAVATAAGK